LSSSVAVHLSLPSLFPCSASFAILGTSFLIHLLFAVFGIAMFFYLGRRLTLRPRNRRLLWIRHD
jgi:ABC-type dipeptide/oligopeptide/nickel transport system permease subunit